MSNDNIEVDFDIEEIDPDLNFDLSKIEGGPQE